MEAAVAIAISLAAAVSGVLVEAVGYECPVEIGLGSVGLSLLYTLSLLPRSVADDNDSPSSTPLLKSVECHVKPASRPKKIFKFLVCLTCFAIYVLSYTGDDNISFLYLLHRPLCWAKDKISIFTGAFSLSKWILVLLFILVAKGKIPEPVFALIGALSAASSYLLKGLASSDLLIFAGALFSGISILQMTMSAVAGLIVSNIYRAGLGFFLGLPYLVLTGLSTINVVLLGVLILYWKRLPKKDQMLLTDEKTINESRA